MLRYKFSDSNISVTTRRLDPSEMTYYENSGLINTVCKLHNLVGNSTVYLNRNDGSQINYRDYLQLGVYDNDTFRLSFNKEMSFVVGTMQKNEMSDRLNGPVKTFLDISLADGYAHPFVTNRDAVDVKEFIYDFYEGVEDTTIKRRCVGDYVLYNMIFLYKANGIDVNKKYILPDTYENTGQCEIWYYIDGAKKTFKATVPSTSMGLDDSTRLLVECTKAQCDEILKDAPSIFYCDDVRYFDYQLSGTYDYATVDGNATWSMFNLTFKPETELMVENGGAHFAISLTTPESTDDEDLHSINYVSTEISKAKSKIIDYEKDVFSPMYYENGKIREVKEIEFNLHFRSHDNDSPDWSLTDDINEHNNPWGLKDSKSESTADLLGKIGFTDDDVFYQHKNIQKSFLRLSFYDSPDRNEQSLLYYSTIFLDSNTLYGKYLKFVRKGVKNDAIQYVDNTDIQNKEYRLDTQLHAYDKFNYSSSSEGFYIYLFANSIKGNVPTPIYMKAEFNHAKYGVTIPLVMPMDDNWNPIPSDSDDFPKTYSIAVDSNDIHNPGDNIYLETDFERLNRDMHIKLITKYDEKAKQTIWTLPNSESIIDGKITFNLYEPMANIG